MKKRTFTVRRSTTGLGLFTDGPIAAGKRIIEYVGPIVSTDIAAKSNRKYFFEVDEKRSIDGIARSNIARYINHSCEPNAEAFSSVRGRVWIWSKKSIKAGEEITIDYGPGYFDQHIKPEGCKCRACTTQSKAEAATRSKANKR